MAFKLASNLVHGIPAIPASIIVHYAARGVEEFVIEQF
jgi:hypothetical protein